MQQTNAYYDIFKNAVGLGEMLIFQLQVRVSI